MKAPTERRLHHIALGAREVERLARFYAEVFALPELARHHRPDGQLRSVWLDLGGSILMVERSEAPPQRVEGIGPGPFLLAFRVEAHERAAWEQRLQAAGAVIESRSEYSSYARDLEGNRVAISHYSQENCSGHDSRMPQS